MYDFWYYHVKQKYGEKGKLCYMDADSFVLYIKTDDIYRDIAKDVKTRFDGKKIMTKLVGLRAKTYSYFADDGSEDKKAKGTKKCVIKRKLKFEIYKQLKMKQLNYLEVTQL